MGQVSATSNVVIFAEPEAVLAQLSGDAPATDAAAAADKS